MYLCIRLCTMVLGVMPADGAYFGSACCCSRVDELYFSDARDQFWDAIIVEYAASSAALKEQYSEIAEAFL